MHFKLREVSIYIFFLLCPKAVSKMFQAIKFANFFEGTTDSFGNLRFFTKSQMYSLLVSMSVKTLSRQKNTVRLSENPSRNVTSLPLPLSLSINDSAT